MRNRQDLPRSSLGALRERALLYDPGENWASAGPVSDCAVLPSAFLTASALTCFLSRLDHTARSLAVYASRHHAAQDSLPAVRLSALARRALLPAGLLHVVSLMAQVMGSSTSGLSWRTRKRARQEVDLVSDDDARQLRIRTIKPSRLPIFL